MKKILGFLGSAIILAAALLPAVNGSAASVPSAPMASVTLDDGLMNQYRNARPVLQRDGLPATYYIIADALWWGPDYMSPAETRQLAAEGNEIGNHTKTHANLSSLTTAQIENELATAQSVLANYVGVTPTTCAYPYGAYNDTVISVAAQHLTACRTTTGGLNTLANYSAYKLLDYYVTTGTTANDIRAAADTAKAHNAWVIFTYHGVTAETPDPAATDDVSAATFSAHMDALRASGIPVKTVAGALAETTTD